jgi:hypothetical protein
MHKTIHQTLACFLEQSGDFVTSRVHDGTKYKDAYAGCEATEKQHNLQGDFLNENPMNNMHEGRAGGFK